MVNFYSGFFFFVGLGNFLILLIFFLVDFWISNFF